MKYSTPEISWHNRDPVYSIDFQHITGSILRLATAGTDQQIRLWNISIGKDGKSDTEFLATLSRHTRAVNVVRFSPDGQMLASGADDNMILLWKLNPIPPSASLFQGDEDAGKENWSVFKQLRSHLEDVYDLSWSSDGQRLLSGSVDNSAILWDIKTGQKLWLFTEHKSFVQGVAFDPFGRYLATMSSDRVCRIYHASNPYNVANEMKKLTLPSGKSVRMFSDDTMKSFFRRLTFSPDGRLLVVPAGCLENAHGEAINTVYIFVRDRFTRPVLYYPVGTKTAIAVRFCPMLFSLRKLPRQNQELSELPTSEENEEWKNYETVFALPYRMVFAVATENSVILYDTQQTRPFGFISNVHYHTLSDISWSYNGRLLVIASTDGYCTIVTFEEGELGETYKKQVHQMFSMDKPTDSSTAKEQALGEEKVPSPIREIARTKDESGRILEPSDESKVKTTSVSAVVTSESSMPSLVTLSLAASSTAETSSSTTAQSSSASSSSMGVLSSMSSSDGKPPRRVAVTTLVSTSVCSDQKRQPFENQPRHIITTTLADNNTTPVVDKPSKDLTSEQVKQTHKGNDSTDSRPFVCASEESAIEASSDLNLYLETSTDSDTAHPKITTKYEQIEDRAGPTWQQTCPRRVTSILLEPLIPKDIKIKEEIKEEGPTDSATASFKEPTDSKPTAEQEKTAAKCPRRVVVTTVEKF